MIQLNQIEGIHAGKKAIVFGCGTSVRLFDKYKNNRPKDLIILGVNDIGEYITPDYNCIFDSPDQFSKERLQTIIDTPSPIITNCREWERYGKETYIVNFNGRNTWHDFTNDNTIAYGIVSPYTAVVCAYHLGCREIGMLGVDFTPDHYNRKDGMHNQTYRLNELNAEFATLEEELYSRWCRFVNLSPDSEIHSVTKFGLDDFLGLGMYNLENC